MKQKSIKINFIMNALLSVSSILFSLITYPYVMRILLPEGNGKVAAAISLVECFNIFAQLGIPTYGIRTCAKVRDNREELSKTAQELLLINVIMTLITCAVFVLSILFIPSLREEKALYLITSISIVLSAIGMEWLYKALEKYTYITVRSLIFKGLSVLAMLLLVKSEEDYVIYAAITVFASYGSLVLNFIGVFRYIDIRPKKRLNLIRHLKPIGIFLAMACATTVYTSMDRVMLKGMAEYTDVGLYDSAVKIKIVVLAVITSLGAVLLPRVSYYVENGMMDEFKNVTRRALSFVIIVAGGATAYFAIVAEICINALSGGMSEYEGAIVPMQIIIITVFVIGLSNILGMQVLVPLGREKELLFIEIAGAATNVIVNFLLIPILRASGAAIGTVAAEIVVTGALLICLRKDLSGILKPSNVLKMAVSLAVASIVCYAMNLIVSPMILSNNRGTVAYLACLLITFIGFSIAYTAMLLMTKEQFSEQLIKEMLSKIFRKR